MKVVSKSFLLKHGSMDLIEREINIHKTLDHPHIIRLYDHFDDQKNFYLVMEYAENGNLYKQMKKHGNYAEKEAFNIFSQVCIGIEFLHNQNIIHRDLKPENLLIDKKRCIKICDFGWSAEEANSVLRNTYCGTLDYMAPEIM